MKKTYLGPVCILCKRRYGFLPDEEGGEFCDCDYETLEFLGFQQTIAPDKKNPR